MKKAQTFRKGICAIILNKYKKVLLCEHFWLDNVWQFPQGGIHANETQEQALFRELKEELGTSKFVLLAQSKRQLRYFLPLKFRNTHGKKKITGQDLTFFLLYYYGTNDEINFIGNRKGVPPEFKEFRWVHYFYPAKAVVYFKKKIYYQALKEFEEIKNDLNLSKVNPIIDRHKKNNKEFIIMRNTTK